MVLLIDDDRTVRDMIGTLLRREGMPLDTASDGEEAIEKLREREYRAVLLDLMLRRRNGLEVLKFLKNEKPSMMRRVVIVSAVSDQALNSLAERDQVWGTVRKPFDIRHLVDVVRACREQNG
jgi:DNA-binding response OmpR family regulator